MSLVSLGALSLVLLAGACEEQARENSRVTPQKRQVEVTEEETTDKTNLPNLPQEPGELEDIVPTQLTYYNFAKEVLDRECANCHGVPPAPGSPPTIRLDTYDDEDGMLGAYSLLARIKARVANGTMPPPDTGNLTKLEADNLIEWVDGGGPRGMPPLENLPPKLSFSSPPTTGLLADSEAAIAVDITNSHSALTWSLYYTSIPGATQGGTLLFTGRSVDETTYSWDTSTIETGSYYLYAELVDGDQVQQQESTGAIMVTHPDPGNTTPVVIVTAPNGGENIEVETDLTISWTISDPDSGDEAAMTYKVEVSSNAGSAWTDLAVNHSATSFTWSIPAGQSLSPNYLIRVTADDGKGGIDIDISDNNFEIAAAPIANPTYAQFDAIAQMSCSGGGCHTNAGGGRGDYTDNQVSVDNNAASVRTRIANDTMPPSGGLSGADKQTMINYLNDVLN